MPFFSMAAVSTKMVDEAVVELRKQMAMNKKREGARGNQKFQDSKIEAVPKNRAMPEPIRLHLSDVNTCSRTWSNSQTGIQWIHISDATMEIFVERVMSFLAEKHPHNITISAFQLYLHEESPEDMMKSITNIIMEAQASDRHRVTISSLRFNPEDERIWCTIGELNQQIRDLHIKHNLQPLALHKIFIVKDDRVNGYVVKGNHFIEFNERRSLGSSPSEKAVQLIADWVIRHHATGIDNSNIIPLKKDQGVMVPCPLGLSSQFYNDEKLASFLKSRGLFVRQSRSATRKPTLRRTSHRTISRLRPESHNGRAPRQGRSATPGSIRNLEKLLTNVAKERQADPHGAHHPNAPHDTLLNKFKMLEIDSDTKIRKIQKENEIKIDKLETELSYWKEQDSWNRQEVKRMRERIDRLSKELSEMTDLYYRAKTAKKERRQERRKRRGKQ